MGPLEHRQLGMALAFPPPFFSVQSYGLYVTDVLSRNILWSTTKVNEACARPPHVA